MAYAKFTDDNSNYTLTNGDKTAEKNAGGSAFDHVRVDIEINSEIIYFEMAIDVAGSLNHNLLGILNPSTATSKYPGEESDGYGYYGNTGKKYNNATAIAYGNTFTTGDVIGVAYNGNTKKIWFAKNNTWQGAGDPVAGTGEAFSGISGDKLAAVSCYYVGNKVTLHSDPAEMTYSAPSGFTAGIGEAPGLGLQSFIAMPYGDLIDYHQAVVNQPYSMLLLHTAFVDQYYGIKLGTALSMYYGDNPALQAALNQYYSDCPQLRKTFDMPYDQLLMLQKTVDMPYILPLALQQYSDMVYSLTGETLRAVVDQPFSILDNNMLKRPSNMPYMLMLDSVLGSVTVSVTIAGEPIDPHHLNIECSIDHADISCEIHLSSEAEFISVEIGMEAEVVVNSDAYVFVVESKVRKRSGLANTIYQIELASPVVLLEAPWSDQITCAFDSDTASNIIDLVAGQSVDTTEFVDFAVLPDTLFANNETPKDIIRKLKDTVGAMIQSNPDGSIKIIPEYPVAVNKWVDATPDYFLTDARNFVSQDETFKHNTGFNIFQISDQITPEERIWTEVEGDGEYEKRVLGFHVPWSDTLEPTLEATKCSSASPPQYIGAVNDIYPPRDQDPEQVEFVAGFATASRPIYGGLEVTCLSGHSLGAITTSEDGRLEAEYKDGVTNGYGLMAIRYTTKYHLWIITDNNSESVQYIMRADIEEDEEGGTCS